MATQPDPLTPGVPVEESHECRLSYDEGWDLIFSLFGSAKEAYAEVGGSDAFMRAERAAWDENDAG